MQKHTIRICAATAVLLTLCACGTDGNEMNAKKLSGSWIDDQGNALDIRPGEGQYVYRTWYGRMGKGEYNEDNGKPMIVFDDFYYDFLPQDAGDGIVLAQNGSGDAESLDHAAFEKGENAIFDLDLSALDGIWQNARGEVLVIDTDREAYLAYSALMAADGNLGDAMNGKGPYLFIDGYEVYICPAEDANSFTLFPAEDAVTDGSFMGVFYRDGAINTYADLPESDFIEEDGHLFYFDGVHTYALPDYYSLADDGLAYDGNGEVFGAGYNAPLYDPSVDWGEDWATNFYTGEA